MGKHLFLSILIAFDTLGRQVWPVNFKKGIDTTTLARSLLNSILHVTVTRPTSQQRIELVARSTKGSTKMLILTRKRNDAIRIGDNIVVRVMHTSKGSVKIGIDAPDSVRIVRGELHDLTMTHEDGTADALLLHH